MTDISVEESIRKLSEAVNQISHAVAATVSTSRYSQLSTAINNQLGVMEAEIDNLASDVEALDAKVELLRVNATQIDDETPAGTIGGGNRVFRLAHIPSPATSVQLFHNGTLLIRNVDFTIVSDIITITSGSPHIPSASDTLRVFYRF